MMAERAADGPVVLFVDDEAQARKWFQRLIGSRHRCVVAGSVAEAQELIASLGDQVGLVMTDQRMPGGAGVDLLEWLTLHHPTPVRILTTAHSDLDSAIAAVNRGAVWRYVLKPWDARELPLVITQALERFTLGRERDALLRERAATLTQLVVLDRVRSLAVLATGLSRRLHDPLLALQAFLELPPERVTAAGPEGQALRELWALARTESQRLAAVVAATLTPRHDRAPTPRAGQALSTLVATAVARGQAAQAQPVSCLLPADLPTLAIDPELASQLFTAVVDVLLRLGPAQLTITARRTPVWGRAGLAIVLHAGAQPWPTDALARCFGGDDQDADADLLAAYLIACRLGGGLLVHPQAPLGPGIEVLLPLEQPADGQAPWPRDLLTTVVTLPGAARD